MNSFLVLFNKVKEQIGLKPIVISEPERPREHEPRIFDEWVDEILHYIELGNVLLDLTIYGVDIRIKDTLTGRPLGMSEESWAKVMTWAAQNSNNWGLYLRQFCGYRP